MITKCKQCIFANEIDSKQTGCSLRVPESLIENYPDIYSNEQINIVNNFYEIENFYCSFARTKEWLSSIEQDNKSYLEQLKQETNIKYLLLLIIENLNNLWSNLQTVSKCENHPAYICLVCRNMDEKKIKEIVSYMEKNSTIPWKLHNILDSEMTTSEAIDLALAGNLDQNKYNLLCIMNNNKLLSDIFFSACNSIMNSFVNKMVAILLNDPVCFDRIMIPISLFKAMNSSIGIVLDYLYYESEDVYKFSITE